MTIEQQLKLCTKLKITFDQFLICLLIKRQKEIEKEISKRQELAGAVIAYTHKFKEFNVDDIEYLLKLNYIDFKPDRVNRTLTKEDGLYLDNFYLTPTFIDEMYSSIDNFWNDILDAYPVHVQIGNGDSRYAKNIRDEDTLKRTYYAAIHGNEDTHNAVINEINIIAKQNNGYALIKLENFINHYLRDFMKRKDKERPKDLIDDL